jgi:hypothetical protein
MILVLTSLMMLSQAHQHGADPKMPKPGQAPAGQGMAGMNQSNQLTEEQKCQFECAREVRTCQMPAAGRTASDANDEEKRKNFMAVSKECMKKSQGCFNACQQKGKKDKGKKDAAPTQSTSSQPSSDSP